MGVRGDGTVFYQNLEYWARAYLRGNYDRADAAVQKAATRLAGAFGPGKPAGGDVKAEDLAGYRYMLGMERFGDRSELNEFASFDQAVQTIRDNLAKGVGETAQVYAIVLPEQKIAVFGVALNGAEFGEGWWVNKIGARQHRRAAVGDLRRRQARPRAVRTLPHRARLAGPRHGAVHDHRPPSRHHGARAGGRRRRQEALTP